jgi:hypothetical protein
MAKPLAEDKPRARLPLAIGATGQPAPVGRQPLKTAVSAHLLNCEAMTLNPIVVLPPYAEGTEQGAVAP